LGASQISKIMECQLPAVIPSTLPSSAVASNDPSAFLRGWWSALGEWRFVGALDSPGQLTTDSRDGCVRGCALGMCTWRNGRSRDGGEHFVMQSATKRIRHRNGDGCSGPPPTSFAGRHRMQQAGAVRRQGPHPVRATHDRACGPTGQIAAAVTARYDWAERTLVQRERKEPG
jgi:hypothetical protein